MTDIPERPEETARLLHLRNALGLKEWRDDDQRDRALEYLRVEAARIYRRYRSDTEAERIRRIRANASG